MKKTNLDNIKHLKRLAGLNEDRNSQKELNEAIFSVIKAAEQVDQKRVGQKVVQQDNFENPENINNLIEKLNYIAGYLGTFK